MKKYITFFLVLSLLLSLLCACAAQPAAQPIEPEETAESGNDAEQPAEQPEASEEDAASAELVSVSREEQLAQTGIELPIPEAAENAEWFVWTNAEGISCPQVEFDYDAVRYAYRAEPTAKLEPYDVFGYEKDWEWTSEGTVEDRAFIGAGCAEVCWSAWLDVVPGIAYTLSGQDEDLSFLAERLAFGNLTEESGEEEQWEVIEPKPVDSIIGTFKAETGEWYLCVNTNRTYAIYDLNFNSDGLVRFWDTPDEQTMVLYDEHGEETMRLHAEGTYPETVITNQDGVKLTEFDQVMNGTYECYVRDLFVDDDLLIVMQVLSHWISDAEVAALQVGSVINHTEMEMFDVTVESIEKKDDTWYVINDEFDLKRDDAASAWIFYDDVPMFQRIGHTRLSENMVFTSVPGDTTCKTLQDCFKAYDDVIARIVVNDRVVESMEIIDTY